VDVYGVCDYVPALYCYAFFSKEKSSVVTESLLTNATLRISSSVPGPS
jgi:hypothetical protein